jgi:fructose-1,6-bisphosphatase/inositol monophosphatase family enzyme
MSDLPQSTSGRTAEHVARLCAEEASRIIIDRVPGRAGGRREETRSKGRGNFVTETDLAVERAVLDILGDEYPKHPVLSEETARDVDANEGWAWVVDPIDGTHNYSQGIPHFCFTIALCRDGEPVLGLTVSAATGDEFFATKGGGLLVNGAPATVSDTASLAASVLGVDLGYDDERAAKLLDSIRGVWPGVQAVRVLGSAALGLAYAACGRFDVYVHHRLFPWDAAAGILFVREGEGLVVQPDGGEATIYSERLVAGAAGPVRDWLEVTRERAWG